MENQKRENLLNLALDTPEAERERSLNLNVGYDEISRTWELIVRHRGSVKWLEDAAGVPEPGIRVNELSGGYAVLRVPEAAVDAVRRLEQIEYIEKPKRLFFAVNEARTASCLLGVQPGTEEGLAGNAGNAGSFAPAEAADASGGLRLTGQGVLVAVIDSGIDYFHPDFRNADGTTRILYLWDQDQGKVYTREDINEALASGSRSRALERVPSRDVSGHGTAVASIAAGNGRESRGVYRGVAFASELVVVKLGTPLPDSFPKTAQLMEALDFVTARARELGAPLAANISFGNTYGAHDGTGLLETFMDSVAVSGRFVLVAGSGNEGGGAGHTAGRLEAGGEQDVELSVAPFETGMGVQLWKSYADQFSVRLITPSGEILGPLEERLGPQTWNAGDTRILVYYGKPSPYSQSQEVYFDFIPGREYLDSGIWTFRLTPRELVTGDYNMWLPSRGILNPATRFLFPVPETTLTIPSTAARLITVGAYDDAYRAYADFSGRGYTRMTRQVKPDVAAPGVNIVAARSGGGYETVTGTSFAAPFVTGSAALLMQWGIVDGNDPFLYGEKVKAYLIRGARRFPGYAPWPNPQMGWGALCVEGSLPEP